MSRITFQHEQVDLAGKMPLATADELAGYCEGQRRRLLIGEFGQFWPDLSQLAGVVQAGQRHLGQRLKTANNAQASERFCRQFG